MTSRNQKVSSTASSLPARLTQARERVLLTQAAVAAQTEIGESSLSEFENGRREPSIAQLHALASVYRRSIAWLLGEEQDAGEAVVLWRQRPSNGEAAQTEARFVLLCERFRNLEVWCGDSIECDLPWEKRRPPQDFRSYDSAILAKRVRSELALGDRPGESLLRTLEEVSGVKVFHLEFEPSGTAACVRSRSFGSGILLNKKNVSWRRAFDTAHELFHLLTWEIFQSNWVGTPPVASALEEKLANVFASNLLMPEEPFRLAVQRRSSGTTLSKLDHAYAVAREFGVSVDAVIVRAKFLFKLPDSQADGLRSEWKERWADLEERSMDSPSELPERFQALARAALRKGDISIGKFAEYAGVSRRQALDLANKQGVDGAETDSAPAT